MTESLRRRAPYLDQGVEKDWEGMGDLRLDQTGTEALKAIR
jgi:hypothetical protein